MDLAIKISYLLLFSHCCGIVILCWEEVLGYLVYGQLETVSLAGQITFNNQGLLKFKAHTSSKLLKYLDSASLESLTPMNLEKESKTFPSFSFKKKKKKPFPSQFRSTPPMPTGTEFPLAAPSTLNFNEPTRGGNQRSYYLSLMEQQFKQAPIMHNSI